MNKRTAVLGEYNTAEYGWTLSSFTLSPPEQKTNYVDRAGGDGSWDLSTVLTGGIPRYKDRTLSITLECSEGDRAHREEIINNMVNRLDGLEWKVVLPDRPDHYLVGRLHIAVNQNSPAYASVTVTGVCAPWLYSSRETVVELTGSANEWKSVQLLNNGRRAVIPVITTSAGSDIQLKYNNISSTLTGGTYEWPGLLLSPGRHTLEYRGPGNLRISYREAVLR